MLLLGQFFVRDNLQIFTHSDVIAKNLFFWAKNKGNTKDAFELRARP